MLKIGSLCTGYGGLDLALEALLGARTAWVSDIDKGANKILEHRFPHAPNIGDLKLVNWSAVEPVDILTAGYPCQPFSNAGKREGLDDPRHIFPWIIEAVRGLQPRLLVCENVAGHLRLGFDSVLGALAEVGYDARWTSIRASDVGAPHPRDRVFLVAHPAGSRRDERLYTRERGEPCSEGAPGDAGRRGWAAVTNANGSRLEGQQDRSGEAPAGLGRPDVSGAGLHSGAEWGRYAAAIRRWELVSGRPAPQPTELNENGRPRLAPRFVEWAMGLSAGWVTDVPGLSRNEMLKALGNGVVPLQAYTAADYLLSDAFEDAA